MLVGDIWKIRPPTAPTTHGTPHHKEREGAAAAAAAKGYQHKLELSLCAAWTAAQAGLTEVMAEHANNSFPTAVSTGY